MSEHSPRFLIYRRSLILGFAVACTAGLPYAEPAAMAAETFQYSADTTAPARRQGMVSAAGINWNCLGSRCTTSGPWATPAIGACRALAQQVGPLRSYGHKGRMLTAGELQQCNAGVPTGQPSGLATPIAGGLHPVAPPPGTPATKPPGTLSSSGPALGPVINAGTLRYAGRGPVVINAGTLRYAGRGPVVIRTNTLTYSGAAKTPGTPSSAGTALGPATSAGTVLHGSRGPVVINAGALRYAGRGPVVIKAGALRYAGRGPVVIRTRPLTYSGAAR